MTSTDAVNQSDVIAELNRPLTPISSGQTPRLAPIVVLAKKTASTDGISANVPGYNETNPAALSPLGRRAVASIGTISANASFAGDKALTVQMQQLEVRTQRELKGLADQVARLTRLIEARVPDTPSAHIASSVLQVSQAALGSAEDDLGRAHILNLIADDQASFSGDDDQIVEAIHDGTPQVRAAAARALAAIRGKEAVLVLRAALDREENRFVATFIRSAIEAAEA